MAPVRLVDRDPRPAPERLVTELVPPPRFADVSFDSYSPDPQQPSQAEALTRLGAFARSIAVSPSARGGLPRLFGRAGRAGRGGGGGPAGVYLDGGFGVGKTHLLASLWHAAPGPKSFGTFVEYTNLVGALGFAGAVRALGDRRLVCIDEFELDDPGDTVLMARLLRELADAGVRLAATSNTLPEALGEGRFAAEDFIREIHALAARFDVARIDGEDYRHRGLDPAPDPWEDDELTRFAGAAPAGTSLDRFDALTAHLARVHPSRYAGLLDGVRRVCWRQVHPLVDQAVALRLVVLADRLYDRDIPVIVSGSRIDEIFSAEMLHGGYRKKYLRAMSRLSSLAREAAAGLA